LRHWAQILALYDLLEHLSGNPMVTLNRAVAAAMLKGPAVGLKLLEPLDTQLAGHYRLDAVRAHLFEMLRDPKAAAEHYRAAARRTTSLPEQHYLTTQAARLSCVGRRQAARLPQQGDVIWMSLEDGLCHIPETSGPIG
jgi:predicted RNA polymerase sigma factor